MPWLADSDVGAAQMFAQAVLEVRTEAELRLRALQALAELVPSDVVTWDRVELATGAVQHEAVPADAEPAGAFDAIVGDAEHHPLLSAHAARRRPALRLSEAVEHHRLSHSELYGELLHRCGIEYEIAIGMRTGHGQAVVAGLGRSARDFSERDSDVLDLIGPALEDGLRTAEARRRLVRDGSPSTLGRPSIRAGCRYRSPGGSRCRPDRHSSASVTAADSRFASYPGIRTRCCSRRRWRGSVTTRSTASD